MLREAADVPSIVLGECLHVLEKINARTAFLRLLETLEAHPAYMIVPLDLAIIKRSSGLDRPREIHDRFIVATALAFNAKVITKDPQIAAVCETIW